MTSVTSSNTVLNDYLANQTTAASKDKSASSATSSDAVTGNLNTFLKILTTQLKNQDPTSATDTNQFTQELVQFTSAEQQINTNAKLDTMINLLSSKSLSSGLGYIGNYVEATASDMQLSLQDGTAEIGFDLAGDASNLTVRVQDSEGKTVATLTGSGVAGTNYVKWDGKDSDGNAVADGAYTFAVTATDTKGAVVAASNYKTLAKVEAIQTNEDGSMSLICGDLQISDSLIDAIYSPGSLPGETTQS